MVYRRPLLSVREFGNLVIAFAFFFQAYAMWSSKSKAIDPCALAIYAIGQAVLILESYLMLNPRYRYEFVVLFSVYAVLFVYYQ